MEKRLFLMGSGGHAKMVIEAARARGYIIECCLSAGEENDTLLDAPVFPESESLIAELASKGVLGFAAVGPNKLRRKLTEILKRHSVQIPTIISPAAYVSPSARIGVGVVIMPSATIGASATIGDGAIINTTSSVDHDCKIGDFVHVAPGCHLAGKVVVKDGVFLGIGSCVIPELSIGTQATIGAGAVVICDVPAGDTWVGVPAKRIK